jgi:hypothetical protein
VKQAVIAGLALACFASAAEADQNARSSNQSLNMLNAGATGANVTVSLFYNESVATWAFTGLTASGGTITFEGSADGKNTTDTTKTWVAINAVPSTTSTCGASMVTTATTDGIYRENVAGLTDIRVRASSSATIVAPATFVSVDAIPGATLTCP